MNVHLWFGWCFGLGLSQTPQPENQKNVCASRLNPNSCQRSLICGVQVIALAKMHLLMSSSVFCILRRSPQEHAKKPTHHVCKKKKNKKKKTKKKKKLQRSKHSLPQRNLKAQCNYVTQIQWFHVQAPL